MSERTSAIIDIAAIHHNVARVREYAPKSRLLAMVKSNAYGHGITEMAKLLTEVDGFGVACLDEAIKLRQAGVVAPIVIMSGPFNEADLKVVDSYRLEIVIHEWFQVELLQKSQLARPVAVWLKTDTGMHRLGFSAEKFLDAYQVLMNCKKVAQPIKLMTHLADADDIEKDTTSEQLSKFDYCTKKLLAPKSVANSAGVLSWPSSIFEWNRPGIMLYGISPIINKTGVEHNLMPAMTLKSKIISIHDLHKNDAVGYGGAWHCPENMRVATVAIGYGDGYPRHAKNGTPTLVHQRICPLIGRVSMDLITIDLRNVPEAKIGDDVLLWGDGLPAEVVARYADTIAYELMCNLSARVNFIYR